MEEQKYLLYTNPATNEHFGQIRMTTPAEIADAHQQLKEAFLVWSNKPVSDRIRILRKFQKILIDSVDEISETLTQDSGKTRQDAMIEVFMTVDMLDQYRKHVARWLRPRRVPRGLYLLKQCHIEYRPYGVVAVIAPWNYPLALSLPPMVSALLAGNTVMMKPSEVTGATGEIMEKLIQRVPELAPYVRVFHGDGSVGAAMVQSGPDYIFLTGSTPTGKLVMKAAAEQLIPVACELGGKDSLIVLEDADIEAAAKWGVWGANYNTGQTCMSVERVYVVDSVYEEFVRRAVSETNKLKVGYTLGTDSPYYIGPITDPRQLKVIKAQLADALAKGARVLVGGQITDMFVEPTILVDVDHSMLVMREETFGPLMPVMRVRDENEAVQLANDCDFGLGASIWSRDVARAKRLAQRVEASSIVINDTIAQFAVPMLPFGGIKDSGYGRIHGKEGLMQFTRPYSYVVGNPPAAWDIATVMRKPGHYQTGTTIMKLAFGVTPQQRLEPITEEIRKIKMPVDRRKAAVGLGVAGALGALAFGLFQIFGKSTRS